MIELARPKKKSVPLLQNVGCFARTKIVEIHKGFRKESDAMGRLQTDSYQESIFSTRKTFPEHVLVE